MKTLLKIFTLLGLLFLGVTGQSQQQSRTTFSPGSDILLAHYDFKTDVDDLHAAAAMATLAANPRFSQLNFHAVAGTYGVQDGLYVPPNNLMQLAFGSNWSDADADFEKAVERVYKIVAKNLKNGGDIWIAEGGQSNFSAALIRKVKEENPNLDTRKRIHLVQHSDWNEEVTSAYALHFSKEFADYHKIPDGNAAENGTPDFRSKNKIELTKYIKNQKILAVWDLAIELANTYNGVEGRYVNEAIKAGGLDFSDFAEVCWILGYESLKDADDYFGKYGN